MEAIGGPADMTVRAWWHALRDAGKAFATNDVADRAAALTYYSTLSIFPGLIVLVGLLGVLGNEDTVDGLLRIVDSLGPASAVDTVRSPLESIVDGTGAAGLALAIGLAIALYSASAYIGAFIRATNEIWEVDEERPFWKRRSSGDRWRARSAPSSASGRRRSMSGRSPAGR
jgi:membrane protein